MKTLDQKNINRGAAVVEFAVMATLLLIFLFGIFEFGFLWLSSYYIGNSAREGARVAAKNNYVDITEKQTAAQKAVNGYLKTSKIFIPKCDQNQDNKCSESENFDVSFVPPPQVSIDIKDIDGDDINFIHVTVTVNVSEVWEPILWPLMDILLPGENEEIRQITQTASFAIE